MFAKKHRFLILKKKYFIFAVCFLLVAVFVTVYFTAIRPTFKPAYAHTIVIDAGHGGIDGGAEGDSGVTESFLNLKYALMLQKICEEYGWNVVQTRSDMNGLYSTVAPNKKKSEMEKRRQIIKKSKADVVVSIHMNSFPLSTACGAQVYYAQGSQTSENLAQSVQDSLAKSVDNAKKTAKAGDYYILNCTDTPSILVECGFLSNPEEEMLLQNEEYMQKFCYNLFCGILMSYDFK